MYYKAHVMHWNVEGADFPQYHDFFGDVYDELFDALDPIAEHLRFLNVKVPAALNRLLTISSVTDDVTDDMDFAAMVTDFQTANQAVIAVCREAIGAADDAGEPAVSNFLQERLGAHQKLEWKIRSLLA
jgi:starvation-inducible DNA-binding protein